MSDDDYRQIFTKKLNYYMTLFNKNQMDLMTDLNLSSSTVSTWCTGKKLPRMGKIQMLADYFGIEKSDLIEEKSSEKDNKLIKLVENLDTETISQLKEEQIERINIFAKKLLEIQDMENLEK